MSNPKPDVQSIKIPTRDEESLLFAIATGTQPGDPRAARHELWTRNQPLVWMLAKKYSNKYTDGLGLTYSMLCSEGQVCLGNSLRCFDPNRGLKFSTYAYTAISNGLRRFINRNRWIRIPEKEERTNSRLIGPDKEYMTALEGYNALRQNKETEDMASAVYSSIISWERLAGQISHQEYLTESQESIPELLDIAQRTDDDTDDVIDYDAVVNALVKSKLTTRDKMVGIALIVLGMSYNEIAEAFHITLDWVQRLVKRKIAPVLREANIL